MKHKKLWLCLGAAMGTLILLTVIAALLGIWPFGEKSLVFWDGNWQYIDYLVYWKEVLSGERSIWYSFSTTLGNNMAAIVGYYLLSPFHLIVLFFDKVQMPVAYTLIYVMKLCAGSAAFQAYLNQRKEPKWHTAVFSIVYGLSGYAFAYGYNIMWLDGVIALPLVAAGIERIFQGKRPTLYVLSLAYSLATCYYIGYMLCLFSVVFFLSGWVFLSEKKRALLRYMWSSLLAGGMAACVLLPEFMALRNASEQAGEAFSLWPLQLNFSIGELCRSFFLHSFTIEEVANTSAPKIFCGIGSLYFAIYYLTSRRKAREETRNRGRYFALLLFMGLVMAVKPLDLIWHGFREPSGCPYRYSFIVCFLLLICAEKGFSLIMAADESEDRRRRGRDIFIPAGILSAMLIAAWKFGGTESLYAAFSLGILLAIMVVLLIQRRLKAVTCGAERKNGWVRQQGGQILMLGLMILTVADVFHNGKLVWVQTIHYEADTVDTYGEKIASSQEAVDAVLTSDENLFRMEIAQERRRGYNDAMIYDYAGISFYSSAEDARTEDWLAKVGICNWREAVPSSAALDTMPGVRYRIDADNEIKTNESAFSLIWSADRKEAADAWGGADSALELNRILKAVSGVDEDVFQKEDAVWRQTDERTYAGSYMVEDDGPLYLAVERDSQGNTPYAEMYVNGERVGFYSSYYSPSLQLLGEYKEGDQLEIEVHFQESAAVCALYTEQRDILAEMKAAQDWRQGRLIKSESALRMTLKGQIEVRENEQIVLAIPYDTGWRVLVDGAPAQTSEAFGLFLGIEAGEGVHEIEAQFYPQGIFLGAGLSVLSVVLLVGILVRYRKRSM